RAGWAATARSTPSPSTSTCPRSRTRRSALPSGGRCWPGWACFICCRTAICVGRILRRRAARFLDGAALGALRLVGAMLRQLRGIERHDAAAARQDLEIAAVAADQRDGAIPSREDAAHGRRMVVEGLGLVRVCVE